MEKSFGKSFAASGEDEKLLLKIFRRIFMKKHVRSLYIGALAMFLSVGIGLNAQNSTPPTQPPDAQAQQPATPEQSTPPATQDQAQPSPTPDKTTQTPSSSQPDASQPAAVQSFGGTVVKSGDKYVLQDADTGTTYDIDHQDEVAKFEGKRVKVKGTLDASGKMIHVQ